MDQREILKVAALVGVVITLFLILLPTTSSRIIDGLTPGSKHYAECDVLVKRELGNPYISSVNCRSGDKCGGFEAMDIFGDYRGNLELSIAGKSRRTSFTIGMGLPLAPANKQVEIKACVPDGIYDGEITLYDGQGTGILDQKALPGLEVA